MYVGFSLSSVRWASSLVELLTSFRTVVLLSVIIESLMSLMLYDVQANGGFAFFGILSFTRTLSPM